MGDRSPGTDEDWMHGAEFVMFTGLTEAIS